MNLSSENLSLRRGGRLVLQQVTASLRPGEITAICGPNGAGKSSLLMGLAGLLEPASGRVSLGDDSLLEIQARERAKAIGYLPQSADVAWDVSVESLVALGRLPHRDRGETEVEAAISALNLEDLRRRPASKLSGGERARALLARVLAGSPHWVLADEPLAALDLAHQLALITHFKTCAEAGQGVVIVLHDLALAMNHADRVLVLREGRLVADGAPDEALSPENIANGWGIATEWLGEKGSRALVTRDT
ncbi:ABC transporter ATP-binding protein [uncultured Erythrobacter sp.]|uniref:ABC transporter ATP-binding protein n=1 Tax=uncultured Erythrobacter sp. TaxID=263913 RepID=UPI00261011B4|nr:ABC transporter ATP-binding protein [uncultured Erythrobacter sp.]